MPFLDTLRSLDAKATPGPWHAVPCEEETASANWGEIAAEHGLPPVARFTQSIEFYSVMADGAKGNVFPFAHAPVTYASNVTLTAFLRSHAARIAALVEVVARLPDGDSGDDPYEYVRSDDLRAVAAAYYALDKEAP